MRELSGWPRDGRSLAKQHTEALTGGGLDFGGRIPIVVFDRGYPSKDLIKYLRDKNIKYVMRVPKGFSSDIDSMGEGSRYIRLTEDIRTRAVVFRLKSGGREALITNVGEEEMETSAFPGLYHKRRPIETKYKQVKQKLEKRKLQRAACG
jgi:hypothetical protein